MKLLALFVVAAARAVFAVPAHVAETITARHIDKDVPTINDQHFIDTVMNAHWFWRRMHCAQDLKWDHDLAQLALKSVNSCSREGIKHDRAGSNLSGVSPPPATYDLWIKMARDCIHGWHEEELIYPYGSPNVTQHDGFLHFTQMVWRDTERMGCAMSNCKDVTDKSPARIYCFYDAMGNNIAEGEFERNVWPPVCFAPSRDEAEARFGF